MKLKTTTTRRISVLCAGGVLAGAVTATIAAPAASAAVDCSPGGVAGTVSSVTASANNYLASHPGANLAVTAAYGQPQPVAARTLRAYFGAHPNEYYDLRGILARISEEGLRARSAVRRGDVAEEILRHAQELPADLIVMSTHGRSGLGRWVYGSIADRVLRPALVMVAKGK